MKYTKKVLSVLMSLMMGFTVMATPILAESPSDQESAGEPEVTETEKQDAEEVTEAPEEETKETETPEVSEEPVKEPEVAEEPEETIQSEETPEAEEGETEKTEEPEVVEEESETKAEKDTTSLTATYEGVTVTVEFDSDAFGGKNVTLVVGEAGETEKAALEELGSEYKAVDISFVDEEGHEAQPVGENKVSVSLKAAGIETAENYKVAHVSDKGEITYVDAETETSNVTEKVKVGETTKTVEVPAETETVTVKDYKTEKYTAYETKTEKVKVPAKYGYRYILKYKKNGKKVKASVANPILKKAKKDKDGKPKVSSKKYKVAKEKYLVKKAYTKTVTTKVPVTKTRKVQSGTHTETKVIKEAYSYEVKEDVYEEVTNVTSTFTAESFSTYALIWKDADDNEYSATIHWGTLSNELSGTFTEFDATTIDASSVVGSASLRAIYPGYEYLDAVYYDSEPTSISVDHAASSTGRVFISDTITRVPADEGSGYTWAAEASSAEKFTIEAGSHIYVIYKVPSTSPEIPSGEDDPNVASPTTVKTVHNNNDGTYTITLEVTGAQITQQIQTGANVIIVYDISQSMSQTIGSGQSATTRLEASRQATHTLINTLKPGTNDIDLALVTFERTATRHQFNGSYWTKSGTDITNVIDDIDNVDRNLGTNWHQSLNLAYQLAANAPDDDDTYIIFITDGCPSSNSFSFDNDGHNGGSGTSNTSDPCYTGALAYAKGIAGTAGESYSTSIDYTSGSWWQQQTYHEDITVTGLDDYLYGIYTGSDNTSMLQTLINASGGEQTITATTPEDIETAFKSIATTITNKLGASEVTVDDGIPDLSSVSANVSGEAGGFVYSKKNKDADDSTYTTWTDAPAASYTEANGVVWDLSEAKILDANTTYRLQFTVWPSQDAYDLLADLNNGVKELPQPDAVMEQLIIKIGDDRYVYVAGESGENTGKWTNGSDKLTTAELIAAIEAAETAQPAVEVTYSIPTNTHLNTTYSFNGNTYSDAPAEDELPSEDMLLDDETIKLVKYWHNELDAAAHEGEDIKLTVTKDDEYYLDVQMGKPEKINDTEWIQEPEDTIFISIGIMLVDSNGDITVKSAGHDYTVEEPEEMNWYWDLTAAVYHPMIINGEKTVLILVTDEEQKAEDFPTAIKNLANNKKGESGGKNYYKFGGKLYVEDSGANSLRADNDRRSNLQIKKIVTGNDSPEDALFKFEINMENPKTTYVGTEGYSSDYDTFWFVVLKNADANPEHPSYEDIAMPEDGLVVSDATAELGKLRTDNENITNIQTHNADADHPYPYITYNYKGSPNTVKAEDLQTHTGTEVINGETVSYTYYSYYTGYYWFDNVEGGKTVTVSIKKDWRICFTNISRYTNYTVEELGGEEMPEGFIFDSVETDADNAAGGPENPAKPDEENDMKVIGEIDESNTNYTVDYTNAYKGFFYVYHSSDNTVERFSMANNGAVVEDFSIYALTAPGTLYGGYYSDYAGKSSGYKSEDLVYTNNKSKDKGEDAKAYDYAYIAEMKVNNKSVWTYANGYLPAGTAMDPEENTTYFLKEVPSNYLLPYTHYTYYKSGLKLANLWTMTAIDDMNYDKVGFVIQTDDQDAIIVDSLSIKAANSSSSVTLTAGKVFKPKEIQDGYLGYFEITDYKGSDIVIKQFWKTKDGITVNGLKKRTLTFDDDTISGLKKNDTDL